MISLKHISKKYGNNLVLNNINIKFNNKELVAILGESGSGKSTLLNIIGGLDKYDSGDLIIDGISTKKYKNSDWDNYREQKVGFIFQNYNLISHLNVLDNVKSSLIFRNNKEKNNACLEIIKKVGMINLIKRNVNDLSGGEKQRVAIARALVKGPEILLCDEPTGALDSKNGIEIMKILKRISKNRLVIVVTHNEELANQYADRIIRIKDGTVIEDFSGFTDCDKKYLCKCCKKNKMSLKTSAFLSLNNLLSKMKRTTLISLAASMGIIGISLILSLSNGVKEYIDREQKETFSNYPIEIRKVDINYNNIDEIQTDNIKCSKNTICTKDDISNSDEIIDSLAIKENNLIKFKKFLDSNKKIKNYTNYINYNYDLELNVYDNNYTRVNPASKTFNSDLLGTDDNLFKEINKVEKLELLAGDYPKEYNDLVLVVDKDNKINMSLLYNLGIENMEELNKAIKDKNIKLKNREYSYKSILGQSYKIVLNSAYYEKSDNYWNRINDNKLKEIIDKSIDLNIVGIVRSDVNSSFVGYTRFLTDYVINNNKKSEIYMEQVNNPDIDILTNKNFSGVTYEERLSSLGIIDYNQPSSIELYPNTFEAKSKIEELINNYNKKQTKENKISYTDILGVLLETITSIVNIISYILIALVAISLVVSSIMIAIITHISVLERTKEIGVLRSLGASRRDVVTLFLAEKLIEGILAGIIGIIISRLLIIPCNIIIERITKISNIASMNYRNTLYLLLISIVVTIISGLMPAFHAAKMSIVDALRDDNN